MPINPFGVSNFSEDFSRGAALAMKAYGIKTDAEQQAMMGQLQQSQMVTQELQRQQMMAQMEQQRKIEEETSNFSNALKNSISMSGSTPIDPQDLFKKAISLSTQYPRAVIPSSVNLLEKYAQAELSKKEQLMNVAPGNVVIDASGKPIYTAPPKVEKPISMGNAAELAMNEKFGMGWMNDPETQKMAHQWLGTDEGKKKVQDWTVRTTPPSFTFPVTDQGIVTAQSRGLGAGRIIGPTGYGKPLTDAQLSKVGELNAVLSNIGKTKELYGYGTPTEHGEWVGPVAGRVGGLGSKYLGTATPDQVKFYAYVKDMQDALLRARSGAQINEQEYRRLMAFLPDPNLPSTTFKARLDRFEEATNIVMEEKLSAFQRGGYGVGQLNIPNTGNIGRGTKTISRTGKVKSGVNAGKTVIEYSDGSREYK